MIKLMFSTWKSLSYIILVSPKSNSKCPYKREAEGGDTQKRRRQCDHRGRDWCDVESKTAGSHPELEEARSAFFSKEFRERIALITP